MNYANLHAALKSSVVSAGFKYKNAAEWFNLELGQFPESGLNDSFTIRIATQDMEESQTPNNSHLTTEIEFVLDAKHDNYLPKISDCVTAVNGLVGVLKTAGVNEFDVRENWTNFTTVYGEDTVILTFDQIKFFIEV